MRVHPLWIALAVSFPFLGVSGDAWGKERAGPTPAKVTDAARDRAIAKGLAYLDQTVFGLPDAAGTPRKQFTVAVTGLVGLLALDTQSKTARGRSERIDKARTFLDAYIAEVTKRVADPSQLPATSGRFDSNHVIQYTWPVAMAGLFYGELHARGQGKTAARKTLRAIVRLLEAAQAPNGGFGHSQVRERGKARGTSVMDGYGAYPDTLLASSNLVASTLAVVAPIAPPQKKDALTRALAYFKYAELGNGNFPYDPSQRSAQMDLTGVSRAAGAALAMNALGTPWGDTGLSRALEYIDGHFAYLSEGHGSSVFNLMLAALLQKQRGPKHWARFKQTFFPRIIAAQKPDGHFECVCENKAFASTNDSRPMGGTQKQVGIPGFFASGTDAYISAVHTLILLLDRTRPRLVPEHGQAPAPKVVTPR